MAINQARYNGRRAFSAVMMGLAWSAALVSIAVLCVILGTLIFKGAGTLSLSVFTQETPPPGGEGGLRNAIFGSLIMTVLGTLVGTPIGILAGTYMAEYGRHSRLTSIVRFINDILLSAPSIVMGLFIYAALVKPLIGFSAIAGAAVLAVMVIPIVVRTTENMLLLVPNQLREAASAMGLPRSLVVRRVTYTAARAGIITGVLLAIARISGETAPLLFTAFGNLSSSNSPLCLPGFIAGLFGSSGSLCTPALPDLTKPMASLPAVIFQFANSADDGWIRLAWTGALLITAAVLVLSVIARWLGSSKAGT